MPNLPNKNAFLRLILLFSLKRTIMRDVVGEVYTAIADMEDVMHLEAQHIKSLESFVRHQEEMISSMKTSIDNYKSIHAEANGNMAKYLANPVNSYLLIKRMTTDWKEVEEMMSDNIGIKILSELQRTTSDSKWPNPIDLNGAATAIARLQKMYLIDANSIANGQFITNNYCNTTKMTASDCHHLGVQLFNNKNYKYAISWFEEAIKRDIGNDEHLLDNIKGFLSLVHYNSGNFTEALRIVHEMLETNPNSSFAQASKTVYENEVSQMDVVQHNITKEKTVYELAYESKIAFDESQYAKLCRYDIQPSPKKLAPLRCRYVHNNVPFLKITPLKLEEFSLDPYIVVYHDVVYDNEIEYLQVYSKPVFERAAIKEPDTDERVFLEVRTSKSAFVSSSNKIVRRLTRRISDMTKLSMVNAEILQVVNYGIGGHYDTHYDFFSDDDTSEQFKRDGNRIATVLFYLSDVEQGGATAFPLIDLVVLPKKGSAVFWYNLHASGASDHRTRHASCPVLVGNKWVANKWIRARDQILKRPCNLKEKEESKIFIPGLGFIKYSEF